MEKTLSMTIIMCCVKQDPVHNMLGVRPSTILSLLLWSPSLFLLFEKATDLTTRAKFSVWGSTETPSRYLLYTLNTVFRCSMTAAQAKYFWMYVWLIFVYIYPKVLKECFVRFLVAGVCICVLNNTCTHSAVPVTGKRFLLYGINGIPYNTITRLPYDAPLLDGTVFTTQCLKPAYTGTV